MTNFGDAAPDASTHPKIPPSIARCISATSAPCAYLDYSFFVICLSSVRRNNQHPAPSCVPSTLFGYNNPYHHRAQVLHNTATGDLGTLTTILFPRRVSDLPKSKHAVGRFKDNIRNDIKERQMEEARAFKAEKIKKRQPINEKTFEEFKTVVAPKVQFS